MDGEKSENLMSIRNIKTRDTRMAKKKLNILGISCYFHDSSACIISGGKLFAAEEERFSRIKHDNSFPYKSIEYCLNEAKVRMNELDYVGFYEKPILKFERIISQSIEGFPSSMRFFLKAMPHLLTEKLNIEKKIRKLGYKKDIIYIQHHMSHAASCFFPSPFKKAAIVTIDGVGEFATTTYGIGDGNRITMLKELSFPNSLGLLYSAITSFLGFSVNNSEYKVMGLSAYGDNRKYNNKLIKLLRTNKDGSFALDMSYFDFYNEKQMFTKKMIVLLGNPRGKSDRIEKRHMDIAAALQRILEEAVFNLLNHVHKETGCDNICLAGGVALNSVLNGKITSKTKFKNIWIQPAAGDNGGSVGAAYYIYNKMLNQKRQQIEHVYLGPCYPKEEIKEFLDNNRITYHVIDESKISKKAAGLLADNKVLGWFNGRMEFGPRALGNRSILANPLNKNIKKLLNEKVKHREQFRPFAPAVCEEDAPKYFEYKKSDANGFMLMVYQFKKKWHDKIPGVVHVNGSGRLQTVSRGHNPYYYDIIKEFGEISGIPIIINTSFNIRGEPIVCTPFDAYRCMMGTGIDCLFLENFLIYQDENTKDMWDCEKIAND